MTQDPSAQRSAPPGSIEFELTDLADARRALDELPAGVAELSTLAPGYWEKRRRRPNPNERALGSATITWVLALPAPLRPHALCKGFPRVGNALAVAWPQAEARAAMLNTLLQDKRGRRAGFPPEVRREIEALQRAVS